MVTIAAVNVGASGPRIDKVIYEGGTYRVNPKDRVKILPDVVQREGFIGSIKPFIEGQDYNLISIGAAGPVKDGPDGKVCDLSQMNCHIDAAEITGEFARNTFLCNDMPPMIAGADLSKSLNPNSTFTIFDGIGIAQKGTRVAIASGSGLGYVHSMSDGEIELIGPSEGGHDPFAPVFYIDDLLLAHMRRKYTSTDLTLKPFFVTQEMVLKGDGIIDILEFLREVTRHKTDFTIVKHRQDHLPKIESMKELLREHDIPQWLDKKLKEEGANKAAIIAEAAKENVSIHCVVAQAMWNRLLGLYVGHKLQTDMPTRGAFLGGTPINKLGIKLLIGSPFAGSFIWGLISRENPNFVDLIRRYPIFGLYDDSAFTYGLARLALSNFDCLSRDSHHFVDNIPIKVV